MRKRLLAAALFASAACVVVPQSASASGSAVPAPTGGYDTQPAGSTASLRELGAIISLSLASGETHYINGILSVGSATTKTEVTELVGCWLSGTPRTQASALGISEAGQNVDAGASVTLTSRFEFTAPAAGTYDCSLDAIFINHDSTTASGHIYVLSGSSIQDAKGPLVAHAQAYQPSRLLVTSSNPADINLIASYSVPVTVSSIGVISDVGITNCYVQYHLCAGPPAESSSANSNLTSQLVVQQLDALGNVCHQSSDSLLSSSVSPDTHHQKLYHRLDSFPIEATCGSFNVKVFLHVAKTGGNDFEVENTNQSYSFLFEE